MTTARGKFQGRRVECVAAAILALLGGMVIEAKAQPPPSSPIPEKPPAQIPEKVAPPLDRRAKGEINHKKFERDDGVIRPREDVDPDMTAKSPDTGARTPVIPPPGSSGGDPSIKPK